MTHRRIECWCISRTLTQDTTTPRKNRGRARIADKRKRTRGNVARSRQGFVESKSERLRALTSATVEGDTARASPLWSRIGLRERINLWWATPNSGNCTCLIESTTVRTIPVPRSLSWKPMRWWICPLATIISVYRRRTNCHRRRRRHHHRRISCPTLNSFPVWATTKP